jgi:hypothetical protein
MVDDAREERKEKKAFKRIDKEVKSLERDHKNFKKGGAACFSAGGVTSAQRASLGRGLARVANQKNSGRGR